MTDIVERLREATIDIETREPLFSGVFGHATVEDLNEAADEIERLRKDLSVAVFTDSEYCKVLEAEIERLREKCDNQAMILRRLTPEKFPDSIFIHAELGTKDANGMPEKLLVVPAYGCDFSYIYERTEKTTGPEW